MKLESGMILVTREYGDLHYLISVRNEFRVIDVDSECIEFNKDDYERAYFPISYNDNWTPDESTIIIF